jgi:hypothetical protein
MSNSGFTVTTASVEGTLPWWKTRRLVPAGLRRRIDCAACRLHSRDVARLFLEFYKNPRAGEVYNLGGGRQNNLSILETVDMLVDMGYHLRYRYNPVNRVGDHICYISDLRKTCSHFPNWQNRVRSAQNHLRYRRTPTQCHSRVSIVERNTRTVV